MGKTHIEGIGNILMDIDIDTDNRKKILNCIHGIPARLESGKKHNSGVYFTEIPVATDGISAMDHKTAEKLGYFKIDILNMSVYNEIENERHLLVLMEKEPNWNRLWKDRDFCEKIVHINRQYELINKMRPDTIPRMAMFLSVIRPGKQHLQNMNWKDISENVWILDQNDKYTFKKSHAVAYAHLVKIHMNLLEENKGNYTPN